MREAKEAGAAANQMNNITTIDNSNNVNAPTTNNQGGVTISDGNLSASTNE